MDCNKISPFVCGNISTYSVTKKSIDTIRYPYHSLNLACSRKKFNFFIRFYYYSDSNIKVKFCVKPPSPQPCPFFLQRTGQRLFLALTDGLPPMHSTLLCWGIRIKTENQFFTSSHSLPISCAVSVQTFAALLPLFSCGFSLCVPACSVPAVISTPVAIL